MGIEVDLILTQHATQIVSCLHFSSLNSMLLHIFHFAVLTLLYFEATVLRPFLGEIQVFSTEMPRSGGLALQ